ncbi:regulatory factor X-associated protein isoform X2 [Bombina bombina]|uniref:regulatory factor X-associated protein isoform X2 n=1 Tax=Bombina bombina TaxID=8345 RepID=UPI00235AD4F8|nr:regulatory factor X-associated protein isoform X2 [Bombina bombina]
MQQSTRDEEEEEEPQPDNHRPGLLVVLQQDDRDAGNGEQELQQYSQYQADGDATVLLYNMMVAEPEDESCDLLDTSDPRDSTASPEELEDDENSGDNDNVVTKSCTYQGCQETTSQVAKQRKPWMCKKHRNKMYKDKYKKKKSDQAMTCTSKLEDNPECSIALTKQKTGSVGDRPARPSLLEQVLNQKRLIPNTILCCKFFALPNSPTTTYHLKRG